MFWREVVEVEAEEAEEDGNCRRVEKPSPLENSLGNFFMEGKFGFTDSPFCAANLPATGPTTTAK